ncbi:MAG: MHO_1590 family protein [Metamycoplasmataceae bacterium]
MNKKYRLFLYIGLPTLLLAGAGLGSWYLFFNKKVENKPDKEDVIGPDEQIPEEELDIKKIFPSISPNHYYDLLEYKENGVNITEAIVVKIIKDVISRIGTDFKKIGYKILENTKSRKEIKFIVFKGEKTYTKTYTFFINVL